MHALELGVQSGVLITIFAGAIIGSVSFAGSMIAWESSMEKIKDFAFKGPHRKPGDPGGNSRLINLSDL